MLLSRRFVLGGLIAAPAVIQSTKLMAVHTIVDTQMVDVAWLHSEGRMVEIMYFSEAKKMFPTIERHAKSVTAWAASKAEWEACELNFYMQHPTWQQPIRDEIELFERGALTCVRSSNTTDIAFRINRVSVQAIWTPV